MLNKNILLLLVLLAAAPAKPKAQNRAATDTTVAGLATRLSISADRASVIRTVMNYHRDRIEQLMRNKTLPSPARRAKITHELGERDSLIITQLTPAERQLLQTYFLAITARSAARANALALAVDSSRRGVKAGG